MKYKWSTQGVGFVILGFMLAYLHALYLGITAPVPGALTPYRRFIVVDDQQQSWVANESSRFGLRQYDLWIHAGGNALKQGEVPDWVLIPTLGTSTISRGFGWPLPALTGAEKYSNAKRMFVSAPGYYFRNGAEMIPTRLLPGIIVNSILFGISAYVLVWTAHKAWFKVFAHREMGPFACKTCGYDMRYSGPICPECGSQKS